jgi:hypothetical protein
MSIQHISRTGKTYFLTIVPGKTGKPKYCFSTRPGGTQADSLPEGFEIYENVNGQVFLRRKTPRLITDTELELVKAALKRHAEEWRYKVEVKKNALIIHEASDNTAVLERIALPWLNKSDITRSVIQSANYTAVLKFILVDDGKRLFLAERFCFRGSVNDWINIGAGPRTLRAVIGKFIKHLGQESIFELF